MAEIDPTELVTIRNESTLEEKEVPRGALPFFINNPQWVELTAAGHRKAASSTTSKES